MIFDSPANFIICVPCEYGYDRQLTDIHLESYKRQKVFGKYSIRSYELGDAFVCA